MRSPARPHAVACKDVQMDLGLLHDIAAERSVRWTDDGLGWKIVDGPLTDKPASWLVLSANAVAGQLTVWVSGEAEMDWGTQDNGGERHYDLDSRDDLSQCVDDLEAALKDCLKAPASLHELTDPKGKPR